MSHTVGKVPILYLYLDKVHAYPDEVDIVQRWYYLYSWTTCSSWAYFSIAGLATAGRWNCLSGKNLKVEIMITKNKY